MSTNATERQEPMVAALVLGGLVVIWELLSRSSNQAAVPPPTAIIAAIWRDGSFLATQSMATLTSAVLGLALALVVAIVVSGLLAASNRARYTVFPLVLASQSIPLIAIAPVLASVIGEGLFATVIITAWLCWYPAVVAFTHAFVEVHPDRMALFNVAQATRWQTFRQLRLPGAAAALASGVRAAAGFAVIGAIVAEYGGAKVGLGATVISHVREIKRLPLDTLFALVVVASVLGLLFTWGAYNGARFALRQMMLLDEA